MYKRRAQGAFDEGTPLPPHLLARTKALLPEQIQVEITSDSVLGKME